MNDNEIKYLNILSEQNCPYIIKIIDNGEGPIVRKEKNNGEPLTRKYHEMKYFSHVIKNIDIYLN